jgi:hypothetical protein
MAQWRYLIALVGVLALLLGGVPAASAQPADPEPAQIPETLDDLVTFARLGFGERVLSSGGETARLLFSVPADWELIEGAALRLDLTTFVSSQPSSDAATLPGGSVVITLNGIQLSSLQIDRSADLQITLPISLTALAAVRPDGRHDLRIALDTFDSCAPTAIPEVGAVVRASSGIALPHRTVAPPIDLNRLPRPIYQGSFVPDRATLVLPDAPTADELRAALITAASFGQMTGGQLTLSTTTIGLLAPEVRSAEHLIFVGKAGAFPTLRLASLPAPVDGQNYRAAGALADDGLVQMAVSPWNTARAVMVVGGNSDAAVVKASQAISSGTMRVAGRSNLALVSNINPPSVDRVLTVDQSLLDLGYPYRVLSQSSNNADYRFIVPLGQTLAEDGYFDLVFNHTALVDFEQSGVAVGLNGIPIGSVRFSEETTSLSRSRIEIPASALRAGVNTLSVRASFVPKTACADLQQIDVWMTVWPESLLHMPLRLSQPAARQTLDLGDYPAPFSLTPTLSGAAFVVRSDDTTAWKVAAQLAYDMGRRAGGTVTDLAAVFEDDLNLDVQRTRDLVVIGRPSELQLVAALRDVLPAPFENGSDIPIDDGSRVVFRLPDTASVGYVQLAAAPWSAERAVLAVLGSNDAGIEQAGAALTDPAIRGQLVGTFVTIDGARVTLGNDRTIVLGGAPVEAAPAEAAPAPTAAPEAVAAAPEATAVPAEVAQPADAPAVERTPGAISPFVPIVIAIGVVAIVIAIVVRSPWRRRGDDEEPAA